jgi:WD40 repeat protein
MSKIATVSQNLKVWDFDGREITLLNSCENEDSNFSLSSVVWSHTNQVLACGGTGNKITLFQSTSGQVLSTLPYRPQDNFIGVIRSLAFSDNSRYLASTINRNVVVWDLKRREIKTQLQGHKSMINKVSFLPDGKIASGDESGIIRVWDMRLNISSPELVSDSSVNALKISPTTTTKLAAGYDDGFVKIWDSNSCSVLRKQLIHSGNVTSLSYSPKNDRLIASGGKDGKVFLCDVNSPATSSPTACIYVNESITSLSFHDNSIQIAVGSIRGNMTLYDWRSIRKPICQISAYSLPINDLCFEVGYVTYIVLVSLLYDTWVNNLIVEIHYSHHLQSRKY